MDKKDTKMSSERVGKLSKRSPQMEGYKFRVWDKERKKMAEVYCLYDSGDVEYRDGLSIIRLWKSDSNEFEVMMYTGRKDRNGREIYEGDVVKTNWDTGLYNEIIFFHKYGAFRQIPIKSYKRFLKEDKWIALWNFSRPVGSGDAEVVGNIYENPELMNGG